MNLLLALQEPNTQWVLAGCMLLGISSGILGCFAFLRGRSLVGDALAHAALPGVCLMYVVTGSKSIGLFLIGAAVSGLLATYCIQMISRHSRIKEDTSLAITLSVFFGIGIVLLTWIQHSNNGNQSGLDKFLFGQAASLVGQDVYAMIIVSSLLIIVTALLFKEFKLLVFDSSFGRGIGLPMGFLDALLMLMLLVSVVIGLQAVGVVLVAAMLIAPSVTARYWTDRLGTMVILAGVFGALSGALGTFFSTQVKNLPTGPVIVLAATVFFLFSLLFSPKRGLLFRMIRFLQLRKKVLQEDLLQAMYEALEAEYIQSQRVSKGIHPSLLAGKTRKRERVVLHGLQILEKANLIRPVELPNRQTGWMFTPEGFEQAHELVLNQRLWDLYHMHETEYLSLGIDKNEDALLPQLSGEWQERMKQELESYNMTPKLAYKILFPQKWQPAEQRGVSV